MWPSTRIAPLAALLALAVALAGTPGVALADDDPDLKIEYAGFHSPTSARLKVT